jgi:hypothetical protein
MTLSVIAPTKIRRSIKVALVLVLLPTVFYIYKAVGQFERGDEKCEGNRCLTLYGTKNSDYVLSFSVLYTTTSSTDDCTDYNWATGKRYPKRDWDYYAVKQRKASYKTIIPIDTNVGGKCQWEAGMLFLSTNSASDGSKPAKGGQSLFVFDGTSGTIRKLDLRCRTFVPKASPDQRTRYHCSEPIEMSPLRLGAGSHLIELNFVDK